MEEQKLIDANELKKKLPLNTPEDECITCAVCKIIDEMPIIDVVSREEYELVCKKLEAAIKDLGNVGICVSCKYCDDDEECKKRSEMETDCFEWRGIKEG